jgi:hypothetical protein
MIGKTEVPGIYKEAEGVLINKDNEALQKYKKKRELLWQKDARLNNLEAKVESLDSKIEEIKSLLVKLTKE